MSAQLTTREVAGGVTIVDIAGRITLGEGATDLRDIIRELLASGNKKLILNLGETSYIDTSGIAEMVSTSIRIKEDCDETLRLLAIEPRFRDLLQITNLYTLFEVFEDEETAIRSFE